MAKFIVREPSSLSDHSSIMAWLNIGTNDNHLATTNTNDRLTRLPKQFIWESNSPQKFRAALQSRDIQRLIHDFLIDSGPDRNINTSLDAVGNIILEPQRLSLKQGTGNGGMRNGEQGTGNLYNRESLKGGISKIGNL